MYLPAAARMALLTNGGQIVVARNERAFDLVEELFIDKLGLTRVGYTHTKELGVRRVHFSDGTILNYTVGQPSDWPVDSNPPSGGFARVVSKPYRLALEAADFLRKAGFPSEVTLFNPDEATKKRYADGGDLRASVTLVYDDSLNECAMAFVDSDALPGTRLVFRVRKMGAFPSRKRPWEDDQDEDQ